MATPLKSAASNDRHTGRARDEDILIIEYSHFP